MGLPKRSIVGLEIEGCCLKEALGRTLRQPLPVIYGRNSRSAWQAWRILRLPVLSGSLSLTAAATPVFPRKRFNKPDSALLHIFQTGSDCFISAVELIRTPSMVFPIFIGNEWVLRLGRVFKPVRSLGLQGIVSGRGLEGRR